MARKCNAVAKENRWRFKKPGILVFFLMWAFVLWDWLPMELSYRHLCATEAGFRQYKTLEDWKNENPGEWEKIHPYTKELTSSRDDDVWLTHLNSRFSERIISSDRMFGMRESRSEIFDIKTGEVLVSWTTFKPRKINHEDHYLKIWMNKGACYSDKIKSSIEESRNFRKTIEKGVNNEIE